MLSAVPDAFAFGEIIKGRPSDFSDWLEIEEMDHCDFPLTRTMREVFGFGGDLRILRNPKGEDRALEGPKAITFVRNHDIDRGQNFDRGLGDSDGRQSFGIGRNESTGSLDRTDPDLAYDLIFGSAP